MKLRMKSGIAAACLAAALMVAGAAQARVVEEQFTLPVKVEDAYGKHIEQPIVVTVFVDDALPGPKPIIVINHGRSAEPEKRATMGRARFADTSRWFASQGFIVGVPTRIGYGERGGEDVESSGGCLKANYSPGFIAAATQVVATLDVLRERPDALKDRAVVLGQSYGGATTTAVAAMNPPGVVAAINFAGGAGGDPQTHAREPCSQAQLKRVFQRLGAVAKVPMLWLYTENDQYFGASYPRQWNEAYVAAGGQAEFIQFPPHGEDGHQLFVKFPQTWKPVVAEFLRKHGFDIKDAP